MNEHIMGEADKISEKGPDVDTLCADLWSKSLHRKKATPEDPKENPPYLAGYRAGVEAGISVLRELQRLLREARETILHWKGSARSARMHIFGPRDAVNYAADDMLLAHIDAALAESAKQMEEKPYIDPLDGTRLVDAEGNRL